MRRFFDIIIVKVYLYLVDRLVSSRKGKKEGSFPQAISGTVSTWLGASDYIHPLVTSHRWPDVFYYDFSRRTSAKTSLLRR